jgi:long-chain acyl-CoA synthetase
MTTQAQQGMDEDGSLVDLLDAACRAHAASPAFVCMDRVLTYAELDDMSRRLAAWLQSRAMDQGARVAVMLPNVVQYPVALAAILRAGYAVAHIDPACSAQELERELLDAGAPAIVILENFAHLLEQVLPRTPVRHVLVASMGELLGGSGLVVDFMVRHVQRRVPEFSIPQMVRFKAALAQGARMPFEPAAPMPGDLAMLQCADGAALSHGDALASVLQAEAVPASCALPPSEFPTVACVLPLCRNAAWTACALPGLRSGAQHLLVPDLRDVKGLIQELVRYPLQILAVENTLYDALVRDPHYRHLDVEAFKVRIIEVR